MDIPPLSGTQIRLLLVLAGNVDRAGNYGGALARQVRLAPSSVARALTELAEPPLLLATSHLEAPHTYWGRPPRRFYALSPAGRDVVAALLVSAGAVPVCGVPDAS